MPLSGPGTIREARSGRKWGRKRWRNGGHAIHEVKTKEGGCGVGEREGEGRRRRKKEKKWRVSVVKYMNF